MNRNRGLKQHIPPIVLLGFISLYLGYLFAIIFETLEEGIVSSLLFTASV